MNAQSKYGESIVIEIVTGGFIVTYPVIGADGGPSEAAREVINSPRKLNNRIKEIISSMGLVADTE